MTGDPSRYAPVLALPLCPWCHHLWTAHWSDDGCQAPTGPDQTCGCPQPPPDHPDRPDDEAEDQAA